MTLANRFWSAAKAAARKLGLRNPYASHDPSNWSAPDCSPEHIEHCVSYGIRSGELYALRLQSLGVSSGSAIMEIGPGAAFGGMAYLRAAGMRVAVSDRWLAPWFDAFHSPVYSKIADRLESLQGFDVAPLRRMVAAKAYIDEEFVCVCAAAEQLPLTKLDGFDAIVSNAVLEHVFDIDDTLESLFRITKPGGVGIHQVDFRDHRNFDRPLEHLLLKPEKFTQINTRVHHEFGSRLRPADYATSMLRAGFRIESYDANQLADDRYLDEVVSRMNRYSGANSHWSRSSLAELSGLYFLRKP